ncbi:MAG: acyltransferase family protein [Roseburia sp.]|nr:acyltransferase family protein [Roseburia sp.]
MGKNNLYKTRIAYLDLLRILSGLLVVMVHVSAQQMENAQVMSDTYVITNAFNCLAFSGVALFVMISGALALSPDREAGIKELLLRRTLRFFALYYIWKAIYQAVLMIETGKPFTWINIKNEIILALVQQRGYYHLWFLPMIAIVYMAVPLIRKGTADRNVCRYFLCVFFVTALLFPTLFHYEFKFKYLFVDFFAANDFGFFGGYLGYFILGHWFHQWGNDISKRKKRFLYIAGGAAFVSACALGVLASRRIGEPSYIMNTPFAVTTFFTVAAIFAAVQSAGGKREPSERVGKALRFGADRVLGIYLLHPLVVNLFRAAGFDASICSPILSIPLVTAAVFLVSGLISTVFSKIPVIGRLVR